MIGLTILKELMIIKQANPKCDVYHCWYFLGKISKISNVCLQGFSGFIDDVHKS